MKNYYQKSIRTLQLAGMSECTQVMGSALDPRPLLYF
jgi:hypothetical protein